MGNRFEANVTPICADWLNTVDQLVFEVFQEAETAGEARAAIDVVEEAPKDGLGYARKDGQWVPIYDLPELRILTMYLGASPSPPMTGVNGQPLKIGMLYYDTTYELVRVFTGTAWLFIPDISGAVTVTNYSANRWLMTIPEAADGSRLVFTMQDWAGRGLNVQTSSHVEIYVDGHPQRPDADYTAAGSVLTFAEAPLATSGLWGIWIDDDENLPYQPLLDWVNFLPAQVDIMFGLEDDLAELVQQVTNLGGGFDRWVYWEQQSPGSDLIGLPIPVDPDLVRVYLDGAPLSAVDDYEIVNFGASVQLAYPLELGSELEVRTYGGTA